ncbi:Linoleate 13S-lipoxygenase 2-1 [Hibiscus syriacus]|uniref:Linoleate 13S-lipoxygenase 2-1 n=1 Tax=Hibiscus syriacus TaxID=106335 RepID=A0A6A3ABA5_HIBSY|nr:Linoleate 13S-lipoxygenase 2-1 [Hibiscus syriacus]
MTFSAKTLYSVFHAVVPSLQTAIVDKDLGFPYFTSIDQLFNEGIRLPNMYGQNLWKTVLPRRLKVISDNNALSFETPESMNRDKFFWFRDEEFARQTFAGINPYALRLVTEWPLKINLDPEIYGDPVSAIIKEVVECQIGGYLTVEEAVKQKKLFVLVYHDLLLPYVKKWRGVYTPAWHSYGVWLWRLAKAHVLAHYSGYHQLVSHCPDKYSIELSSVAYELQWRFDHQVLPADLISRGLTVEDPEAPHGLRLAIKDYPLANDRLALWDILKEWFSDYVNHYHPDASLVESDKELQAWWTEIREVGHGDKKDEPWWPLLKTPEDLIQIVTTIAWKPEALLLECFPSQIQAATVMAILDVLSKHSPDEEYLGEKSELAWADNPVIKAAFEKFNGRLMELEGIIDERNANQDLKNRNGAGIVPYEFLKPFSEPGVTGKGVPYSISI